MQGGNDLKKLNTVQIRALLIGLKVNIKRNISKQMAAILDHSWLPSLLPFTTYVHALNTIFKIQLQALNCIICRLITTPNRSLQLLQGTKNNVNKIANNSNPFLSSPRTNTDT